MSFKMKRTIEMRRVESAFADYLENEGSLTSTCFLSIGVHAEHFTQQNK